ncbi:MAG: PQQ-like beta-propeller repeat protein [Planctomycetia bacterium]|nr:PQQ-like beta-propeller repeat protein [Planctomycetia bacterium]
MRVSVILSIFFLTSFSFAEDWTHWRGPTMNGVGADKDLPDDWNPKGKNVIWTQPVGSRSAPVVSRGKVYLIGSVNPDKVNEQERVTCMDAETGKILWEHRFNVFLTDIVTNRVGWAVPCADAETGNVYTHGTQGLLTCFSEDGKIVWQHSLTEEYGRVSGYGGRTSSPTVIDDLVIIHMVQSSWGDNGRGGFRFAAFDKKTGVPRWWSEPGGPPADTTYSVPIAVVVNGTKLVVAGGGDGGIHALKAATGEKVWTMPLTPRGVNVSPVADHAKGYVYFCQSEENFGTNVQGTVLCVDASKTEADGKPRIVWKKTGILSGFGSPVLHDGRLYVVDNLAKLICLDAATGNEIFQHKYGRNTKGSPLLVDGKFYVGEVSSTWHCFRLGKDKCEKLSSTRIPAGPGGTLVEVNSTPAVSNGRLYFADTDNIYCVGKSREKPPVTPATPDPTAQTPKPTPGPATYALVTPGDITVHPGQKFNVKVRLYDSHGIFIGEQNADEWTLPTAPPPPNSPPNAAPIPALMASVSKDGEVIVSPSVKAQSGVVQASIKVGDKVLTAKGRVRVAPVLPFEEDFEQVDLDRIPTGWINLAGKFRTLALPDGTRVMKKLANNANPLLARAYGYIGLPEMSDYTISADIMGTAKEENKVVNMPDMGLANCRYSLTIDGTKQKLQLRSWEARRRVETIMDFTCKPGQWYSFKFKVSQQGDKAICEGKVWPKNMPEPAEWTIRLEDPSPNRNGAPALYAYSTAIPTSGQGVGTETFFDNVKVVPNSVSSTKP